MATLKFLKQSAYDELINAESAIGRTLFGPVPAGRQREFFLLGNNTWLWYESFYDQKGILNSQTIRYEVKPNGVYKSVAGQTYTKIAGAELENFRKAANNYYQLLSQKLYN